MLLKRWQAFKNENENVSTLGNFMRLLLLLVRIFLFHIRWTNIHCSTVFYESKKKEKERKKNREENQSKKQKQRWTDIKKNKQTRRQTFIILLRSIQDIEN